MQKFQDNLELIPFIRGKIKLYQKKKGYRFSIDPVLLADFVKITKKGKLVDLGTGSGIILLLLALRYKTLEFYGIEIQEDLYKIAKENFKLNNLKVNLIKGDVKKIKEIFKPHSFEYVVANPPFYKPTGKTSNIEEVKIAKFEIKATVKDFIEAASYLLKDNGKFFLINQSQRLSETINVCIEKRLIPKRIRFVHPRIDENSSHFLVESVKGAKLGGEIIEKPLILYGGNNKYTEEVEKILEEFQ